MCSGGDSSGIKMPKKIDAGNTGMNQSALRQQQYERTQRARAPRSEFENGFDPSMYKTDDERTAAEDRYNIWLRDKGNGASKTFTSKPSKDKTTEQAVVDKVADVITNPRNRKKKSDGRSGTVRTSAQGIDSTANLGGTGLLGG